MLRARLILVVVVLGTLLSNAHPQGRLSSTTQIYGEPNGLTGADCEGIMMRLDFVAIAAEESGKDSLIIVISRPGSRERVRGTSRRRLLQAADYLSRRVSRDRLVIAEGERALGLGQLEFYVGGKLNIIFKVKRNSDLVRGCGDVGGAGLKGGGASRSTI